MAQQKASFCEPCDGLGWICSCGGYRGNCGCDSHWDVDRCSSCNATQAAMTMNTNVFSTDRISTLPVNTDTVFEWAWQGQIGPLRAFLTQYPIGVQLKDQKGRHLIHVLCRAGFHTDAIQLVQDFPHHPDGLETSSAEGNTLLHYVAAAGKKTLFQQLCVQGCDPQRRNAAGWTPQEKLQHFINKQL